MDLSGAIDGSGGRWTEERHSRFLNLIESTFVHQMLGRHSDGGNSHQCAARFDRRVPDSVTGQQSAKNSHIRSPPAAAADPDRGHSAIVAGVNGRYTRKRSLRRYDASLDQVVPELIIKNDGEAASKGM